MNGALLVVAGLGAGFLLASWLIEPSSCCKLVGQGARDRAQDELPGWAVLLGDKLNLWKFAPGLAGLFGGA
jgi:hypothetical protein